MYGKKIQGGNISQGMSFGGGVKSNFAFSSLNFLVFSKRKYTLKVCITFVVIRKDTFLLARISQTVVTDFKHYPKENQHQASPSSLGDFQDPFSQLNFL